jgi:hypothetical protein
MSSRVCEKDNRDSTNVVKNNNKKDKDIPVTCRGDPKGCEMSRLQHFLDNRLIDGGELSALHTSRPLPPGRILVLVPVRG